MALFSSSDIKTMTKTYYGDVIMGLDNTVLNLDYYGEVNGIDIQSNVPIPFIIFNSGFPL